MNRRWQEHVHAAINALQAATSYSGQPNARRWLDDALSEVNQAIAEYENSRRPQKEEPR
jgi:hypothetical protein